MKNIAILCIVDYYRYEISKLLCDKTNKLYVNVDELLEFNLVDIERVLLEAGESYFDRELTHIIKNVVTYTDSVITINYQSAMKPNNLKILTENTLLVGLKVPPSEIMKHNMSFVDSVAFEDRQKNLVNYSTFVLDCNEKSKDEVVDMLIDIYNKNNDI